MKTKPKEVQIDAKEEKRRKRENKENNPLVQVVKKGPSFQRAEQHHVSYGKTLKAFGSTSIR